MPLSLALGYKAPGRDAEPTVLYCGNDASAAQDAAKKASGFIRVDYIKAPIVTKRVFHEVAAPAPVVEAAAPAPAAEVAEPDAAAEVEETTPSPKRGKR